jgi:hypothetical protein
MKVLPKEYTDLKDSEMQVAEAGSRWVLLLVTAILRSFCRQLTTNK